MIPTIVKSKLRLSDLRTGFKATWFGSRADVIASGITAIVVAAILPFSGAWLLAAALIALEVISVGALVVRHAVSSRDFRDFDGHLAELMEQEYRYYGNDEYDFLSDDEIASLATDSGEPLADWERELLAAHGDVEPAAVTEIRPGATTEAPVVQPDTQPIPVQG